LFEVSESSFEVGFGFLMSTVKFLEDMRDELADLHFGQRADTSDNTQHAVVAGRLERSQDDTLAVGR